MPREVADKARVYFKREDEREKANYYRNAWFFSSLMNCWVSKTIQPKKLLPACFGEPIQPKGVLTKEQKEQRHQEMLETAAKHKKAFWMKTKGTPEKIKIFGDDVKEGDKGDIKPKKVGAKSEDAIKVLKFVGRQ